MIKKKQESIEQEIMTHILCSKSNLIPLTKCLPNSGKLPPLCNTIFLVFWQFLRERTRVPTIVASRMAFCFILPWTDGQTPPPAATSTLVLNPQTDPGDVGAVPGLPDIPHGSPDAGWKEWGIFPLFSVAGCYLLEVSWSGGSWQSSFAVGN